MKTVRKLVFLLIIAAALVGRPEGTLLARGEVNDCGGRIEGETGGCGAMEIAIWDWTENLGIYCEDYCEFVGTCLNVSCWVWDEECTTGLGYSWFCQCLCEP